MLYEDMCHTENIVISFIIQYIHVFIGLNFMTYTILIGLWFSGYIFIMMCIYNLFRSQKKKPDILI